jgi:hypothetical protein
MSHPKQFLAALAGALLAGCGGNSVDPSSGPPVSAYVGSYQGRFGRSLSNNESPNELASLTFTIASDGTITGSGSSNVMGSFVIASGDFIHAGGQVTLDFVYIPTGSQTEETEQFSGKLRIVQNGELTGSLNLTGGNPNWPAAFALDKT